MKQVKLIHDRKLRFAITGCGRISENHFCALEKHADRVELVAVCDIDDGALKKAMARTNSQGFKSYSEMHNVLYQSSRDVIYGSLKVQIRY